MFDEHIKTINLLKKHNFFPPTRIQNFATLIDNKNK